MMERTKKVGQNEDSDTFKIFFQIANLLFRNKVTLIISIKRQAKNDYYEASDSVLQIGHLLGSNAV